MCERLAGYELLNNAFHSDHFCVVFVASSNLGTRGQNAQLSAIVFFTGVCNVLF